MRNYDNNRPSLEEAVCLVSIPDIWDALHLPGQPKSNGTSPFPCDGGASFSVWFWKARRQWRFKNHQTGHQGDSFRFLLEATNCSYDVAVKGLIHFAKTGRLPDCPEFAPPSFRLGVPPKLAYFPVRDISEVELNTLACDLNWGLPSGEPHIAALNALKRDGMLHSLVAPDYCPSCWVLSDALRIHAEARQLGPKSASRMECGDYRFPGSERSWPIGNVPPKQGVVLLTSDVREFISAYCCIELLRDALGESETRLTALYLNSQATRVHPAAASPFFDGRRVIDYAGGGANRSPEQRERLYRSLGEIGVLEIHSCLNGGALVEHVGACVRAGVPADAWDRVSDALEKEIAHV